MRRKVPQSTFVRGAAPRALRPVRRASLLPTAAALALALAGIGCSTAALDTVGPDPVAAPKPPPPPAPSASPSPSGSAPFIAPDPHEIEGGLGVVKPSSAGKRPHAPV